MSVQAERAVLGVEPFRATVAQFANRPVHATVASFANRAVHATVASFANRAVHATVAQFANRTVRSTRRTIPFLHSLAARVAPQVSTKSWELHTLAKYRTGLHDRVAEKLSGLRQASDTEAEHVRMGERLLIEQQPMKLAIRMDGGQICEVRHLSTRWSAVDMVFH